MHISLLKDKKKPFADVLYFQIFFKIDALENLGTFTGKTLVLKSPFIKL